MQTQSAASLRRARVKPRVSLARSEIYGARHLSKLDYKRHICKDTPRLIFIYIKPCNSCGKMRLRTRRRRRPKAPAAKFGGFAGVVPPRGHGGTVWRAWRCWKSSPTWNGRNAAEGRGRGARSGGDAALGCEPAERRMTLNPSPARFPSDCPSWQAPGPRFWVTQQDPQCLPVPHQLFVYEVPFVAAIKARVQTTPLS